ncbi:MAG: hypothetical protein IKS49_02410 [Actinomycetaceae bacterium]|nr:hypothetical protein [Actinomycetaceae bacterium]
MSDAKKIEKILKRRKQFFMEFSSGWYGRPYDSSYRRRYISEQEDSLIIYLDFYGNSCDVFLKKPLRITVFCTKRFLRKKKWVRIESPHIIFSDETKKLKEEKDGWVEFFTMF